MSRHVPASEIASAAGRDAANQQMRAAGRTAWNRDDYNRATEEYARVMQKLDRGTYSTPKAGRSS